ncbi:MAG: hypothetical protein PGN26_15560 [Xylophilus ampelinus]
MPSSSYRSHRISRRARSLLTALATVWGCYGLPAQAAPTLTLQQAATEAMALKRCPKKAIGRIEAAVVVDANGQPVTKASGPVFLTLQSMDSADAPVAGPLDRMPTPAQLEALKGQRMCVLS